MHTKRKTEELFYLAIASATILFVLYFIGIVQVHWSIIPKNYFIQSEANKICNDGDPAPSGGDCNSRISNPSKFLKLFKPENNERLSTSPFLILLIAKNQSDSELLRIIKNVIKMANEIPIVIFPNEKITLSESLKRLPVHFVPNKKSNLNYLYSNIRKKGLPNVIRNIFNFQTKEEQCPKMVYKDAINILTMHETTQDITTFTLSDDDKLKQLNSTFGDSEFHPYSHKMKVDLKESMPLCDDVTSLKRSFEFIQENFQNFKYLIVLDGHKNFTPNLMSYFQTTSKIFEKDLSVYCISAHNPLTMENADPPEDELGLVDHFVHGGASLFPRNVMLEILNNFQMSQEPELENTVENVDVMTKIEKWFTWWTNRKRRACVVPDKSRVCPHNGLCSQELTTSFDLDSLIRFRYFIKMFNALDTVRPMLYEELPCQNTTKPPLDPLKNETSYAIYVKMISQDDNLALSFIFKCFGIDHQVHIGSYENLYKFYWGSDAVYVVGVPYSNFGPSIKTYGKLYMLQNTAENFGSSLESIMKANDYNMQNSNLTTVPFEFKDDENNDRDNGSSSSNSSSISNNHSSSSNNNIISSSQSSNNSSISSSLNSSSNINSISSSHNSSSNNSSISGRRSNSNNIISSNNNSSSRNTKNVINGNNIYQQ